jgi:hypothetical protein
MVGDRDVHDTSPFVRDDHQHKQEPACGGRHDEEVRGSDLMEVILQKRAPGLRRRRAAADHVLRDRRLTDVKTQFQ